MLKQTSPSSQRRLNANKHQKTPQKNPKLNLSPRYRPPYHANYNHRLFSTRPSPKLSPIPTPYTPPTTSPLLSLDNYSNNRIPNPKRPPDNNPIPPTPSFSHKLTHTTPCTHSGINTPPLCIDLPPVPSHTPTTRHSLPLTPLPTQQSQRTTPSNSRSQPSHHRRRLPNSIAFQGTKPARFVSRVLMIGTVAFFGYHYYQWRAGNEKYFDSLEAIDNGDEEELKKHPDLMEKIKKEKEISQNRDETLRVPKLQPKFAVDIIPQPKVEQESKLRDYEEKLGTINNDYTEAELERENKKIDRQYLKILMDTMDKIVIPSSQFLNTRTSFPAAHAILRIQQGASKEEINDNYRELMRINHPDIGGSAYLAAKISEAKELLYDLAPSDGAYMSKRDEWKKRLQDRDDEEYNEQLQRRLDIIQRRKEIMEFRQKQWGTPNMNREPMVVENEASRRVHTLDFGIMQMNRGEWPTIPFSGWKPKIFRTPEEDDKWDEYKKIRFEIKHAPIRREIEAYHEQQRQEWDMIKYEKGQWEKSKTLSTIRPVVSHRPDEEIERDLDPERHREDVFYNTSALLRSKQRQVKSDFHLLRGTFGEEPKPPNPERPDNSTMETEDADLSDVGDYQLQQHLPDEYWGHSNQTEKWKHTQWEPYQIWKHHRY